MKYDPKLREFDPIAHRNPFAVTIDLETFDPQLRDRGSGARRQQVPEVIRSKIAGIGIGVSDKRWQPIAALYLPIGHGDGENIEDRAKVFRYVQKVLDAAPRILGANLIYDLEYLLTPGMVCPGEVLTLDTKGKHFLDVQVMEPLLDENKRGSYSLDAIAEYHLGEGKPDDEIYRLLADRFGGEPTRTAQAKNIWRAKPEECLDYVVGDITLPTRIYGKQRAQLHAQGLRDVQLMEVELFPMLLGMKMRGVRVDAESARTAIAEIENRVKKSREEIKNAGEDWIDAKGMTANMHDRIGAVLEQMNRDFEGTAIEVPSKPSKRNPEKTTYTIRKEWIEANADPEGSGPQTKFLYHVQQARRLEKAGKTFIEPLITACEENDDGRIHAQFNQLKSDAYGTVSGRFSSSNPNLQNQPSRDPEIFKMVRGLFVPEPGHLWGSADYSQIEYRLLIHEACVRLKGIKKYEDAWEKAMEFAELFINAAKSGVKVDVHEEVGKLCSIDRRFGKTINFGIVYGLGEDALIEKLARPRDECTEILTSYHERMPFARALYRHAQDIAKRDGFITTIGGRKRRYNRFQLAVPYKLHEDQCPAYLVEFMEQRGDEGYYFRIPKTKPPTFDSVDMAKRHYLGDDYEEKLRDPEKRKELKNYLPRFQQAKTHTALNGMLQGGAADIMKRAMVEIWRAGLCGPDKLGAPLVTVHDELNWSIPPGGEKWFRETVAIMENVFSDVLRIPLLVDHAIGATWADCK
jgi:DNA polymerase I-like protein with 3'-5' exonuclease and polymerase domains